MATFFCILASVMRNRPMFSCYLRFPDSRILSATYILFRQILQSKLRPGTMPLKFCNYLIPVLGNAVIQCTIISQIISGYLRGGSFGTRESGIQFS